MTKQTKDTLKKVMIWITVIIVVIGAVGEAITALQTLPFIGYWALALVSFSGRKVAVPMLILSGIMAVINFLIPSFTDVVLWVAVFALYIND